MFMHATANSLVQNQCLITPTYILDLLKAMKMIFVMSLREALS
jgi:hypothetical protein